MHQQRALPTWWYLSWYGLRASLEQLPTECTRVLARLSVVGCTSFQNTVSFPLLLESPVSCCLFLASFLPTPRSGAFASNHLKCSSCSPSISFISFFSQSSLSLANCNACTRLSLRYFKRTQCFLTRRFSNVFLFPIQGQTVWYVWLSYKDPEKAAL